ncbi:MAG TPA: hypothetical protein DDW94_12295 [Deltaproteobacteria bacterium]|nr:MAG: hypothetical protein A2Z79_08440 [Deltaproteobacteria bacterium GWA2_55_82]OGQ63147.1 MAG: hypothetical protein A3I81_10070 [Deltaproteobacteria bacterium RIFCSPLOWO2_02_FULL_55_12]OIJ73612.1 MAG: hypothetical protein A2V21_304635 [Deltaproteobacteria bacterium GWC2_55_46]HBG47749.1 hypothetical protein [Deltaproteobacteria bacterium]HCY12029.1 hypothetical protein [Deltaproteobacteria bacterium]
MYGGLLENRFFHFAAFSLALAIGISQSFSGGSFPLGGDGDFHLSYSGVLRYFYAWSEDGLGTPNYAVEAVWPLPAMLSLLETFMDVWAVKLVLNFSLYFLMFASAYLVCVELKVTPIRCFLLSAFFVLNPLSFSYFSRLNMSLAITPAAMMLFFWVILRFYGQGLRLFFYFGAVSTLLAFANTNPPLMAILQLSILLSVLLARFASGGSFDLREAAGNYLIVLLSFIIFNAWWIVNLFSFVSSGAAARMYTGETASSFLDLVVSSSDLILPRVMMLRTGFTVNPYENFFGAFYNSAPAVLFSAIPVAIAGVYAATRIDGRRDLAVLTAFLACLVAAFLAKGTSHPFGLLYAFLFEHAPFFNIFKGPIEKFGVLFLFSLMALLMLISTRLFKKSGKAFDIAISAYLLFFSVPLFTGQLFPESAVGEIEGYTWAGDVETLAYRDKPGFMEARRYVERAKGDFRVLTFPGNKEYYAVTFRMYGDRLYSGVDPVFSNTGRPFIIYGKGTEALYSGLRNAGYERLLGLYNIGMVSVNRSAIPRYRFAERESAGELKRFFAGNMGSRSFGDITIFESKGMMLPRIYSSGI